VRAIAHGVSQVLSWTLSYPCRMSRLITAGLGEQESLATVCAHRWIGRRQDARDTCAPVGAWFRATQPWLQGAASSGSWGSAQIRVDHGRPLRQVQDNRRARWHIGHNDMKGCYGHPDPD
jgi:hypothetical protein